MGLESTSDLRSQFASISDCQGFVDKYQEPGTTSADFYTAPNVYMYPCGLVAASMYNDTFYIQESNGSYLPGWKTACDSLGRPCPRNPEGVAWPSDVEKKFKSPSVAWISRNCRYVGGIDEGFIDPQLYAGSPVVLQAGNCTHTPTDFSGPKCGYRVMLNNSGVLTPNKGIYNCWHNVTDQDFIVWMRVAALPNFKKLFRKIPKGTLKKGATYNLLVHDRFPVEAFGGSKSVVLSTTTWIGGKNDFLGSAYVAVGAICIGLALVFLATHLIKPRKLGDPAYLDFNK